MRGLMRGFTFIELVVVIGIIAVTVSITSVSLLNYEERSPLTASVNTVLADIGLQQAKAMAGEGETAADSYGIHFLGDRYVLFKGSSYNAADPSNAVVPLEAPLVFVNVLFINGEIVFTKGSGVIAGFSPGSNSFAIRQPVSNQNTTIQINKYGAVTAIN